MSGLNVVKDHRAWAFILNEEIYLRPEDARAVTPLSEAESTPASASVTPPARAESVKAPGAEADAPARAAGAGSVQAPGAETDAAARAAGAGSENTLQPPPEQEPLHYLGENRRFILVLVDYPGQTYLPEAERAYLEQVLSAVKVSLEDIALLNYANCRDRKYSSLKSFFAFEKLLLFGVDPSTLQLPGPVFAYHLGQLENVKVLAADSTEVFRPDSGRKRMLWAELQKMFP